MFSAIYTNFRTYFISEVVQIHKLHNFVYYLYTLYFIDSNLSSKKFSLKKKYELPLPRVITCKVTIYNVTNTEIPEYIILL